MELTDKIIQRFWKRVRKSDPDKCWIWRGATAKGYGMLRVGERNQGAHRISYYLAHGDCPKDLMVLHACDNPRCVNPAHLSLGTCADNIHDMHKKGRGNKGEKNGNARLTTKQVVKIKLLLSQNVPCTRIASMMRVTLPQVRNISQGHTWKP